MPGVIQITQTDLPQLKIYTSLNESQLRHFNEPEEGLFIAESPKVINRALDAGYKPVSMLLDKRHITGEARDIIARCPDIDIYAGDESVLAAVTGFELVRGALCAMRRRELPSYIDVCSGMQRIAVLENVVNPANTGAIFRSAAALGIDAVLLTPGCSDPFYRRAVRVSMGTVFQIPWTYIGEKPSDWPEPGLDNLKKLGFACAAMALSDRSVSICDSRLTNEKKLAVILGTEGEGLADSTINGCDYTVKIPMSHSVDSLNVAAASAVAFWQLGING